MTDRVDTFDRANSTTALGTPSDGGSNWVAASGTWGIVSTTLGYEPGAVANSVAYLESSVSNVKVKFTATVVNTTNVVGCVARLTDDANYLLYFPETSANGGGIYKKVTNSFSLIGSGFTTTIANNDTYEIWADSANLITAVQNTNTITTRTDSFNASATKHGMWNSGTTKINARYDNFSITQIVAGGGPITHGGPLKHGALIHGGRLAA